jgi:FHA domain
VRVRLRHLTLTRSGKPAVREEHVDVDVLTVGRGTNNHVHIPGLTVPLSHAALYDRTDGVYIEPREARPLTVNGHLVTTSHVLRPGDIVTVGQYEIRVLPPQPDERIALEIEQVQREPPETEALLRRTRVGVERGAFTRRKLSWAALAAVLLLGLAYPLTASRRGQVPGEALAKLSWATGPVSRVHSFKAADCAACHAVPFAPVRDQECQACHATTGSHTPPGRPEPPLLASTACAACHPEHRGDHRLIATDDRGCTGCHADIKRQVADTKLSDVSRFAADARHPEFTLVAPIAAGSTTCERMMITPATAAGTTLPRQEPLILRGGLRFAHALHLQPNLRNKWAEGRASGVRQLHCPDCHVPDAGGALMRPIRFAEHCQSCHDLAFADASPDHQVRHPAQPPAVEEDIFQLYAAHALQGDRTTAGDQPTRRRPGSVLTEPERLDALAWARKESGYARDDLLGKFGIDAKSGNRGACAVCHSLTADGSSVVPVRLAGAPGRCWPGEAGRVSRIGSGGGRDADADSRWMQLATFSHEVHRSTRCDHCHRVEDAATSPTGMLPGRSACIGCHRHGPWGSAAALDACVQCHAMHVDGYGPMHAGRHGATVVQSKAGS